MKELNVKYNDRKNEIIAFYSHFDKVNVDNIEEVNDHIIDIDLKKEHFDDPLEEFYNIVAMCLFMSSKDLYDEYFFETYKEILDDYNNGAFSDYNWDSNDKEIFKKDLEEINEHLKKDQVKSNYYDNLSKIYDNKKE